MTEHKEGTDITTPFTEAQIALIRKIVDEQIALYEKRKLHEARFGVPYPLKEHK